MVADHQYIYNEQFDDRPILDAVFSMGMGCNTCLLEPGLEPNTWEYRTERGGHCWYRTVWI